MSAGRPTAGPVFVVGSSRAGTTLLGIILGRHPDVFTFWELHFFEQIWTPGRSRGGLGREDALGLAARLISIQRDGYLGHIDAEPYLGEAERVLEEAARASAEAAVPGSAPSWAPSSARSSGSAPMDARRVYAAFLDHETRLHGARIPCEQTPRNAFYLPEIQELFPECRIVQMVRDPRDVVLSQKFKWRQRSLGARNIPYREVARAWLNYHPVLVTRLWRSAVDAVRRDADPERLLTVRFEDLVRSPEPTLQRVCDFLGLDFRVDMLEVSQEVALSSHRKRRQARGLDARAAERWRGGGLSRTEKYLCERTAARRMQYFGYEPERLRPNPLTLAGSIALLPVRVAVATLVNLRRIKSLPDAIRRRWS